MDASSVFAAFSSQDAAPSESPDPSPPSAEVDGLWSQFARPVAAAPARGEDSVQAGALAESASVREATPPCQWSDLLLAFADAAAQVGDDIRTEAGVELAIQISGLCKTDVAYLVRYLDAGLTSFLSLHPESASSLADGLTRDGRAAAMMDFLFDRNAIDHFVIFFQKIEAQRVTSMDVRDGYAGTVTGRVLVGAAMVLLELEAHTVIAAVNTAVFRTTITETVAAAPPLDPSMADLLSSSSRELAEAPAAVPEEEQVANGEDMAASSSAHLGQGGALDGSWGPVCIFGGYSYDNRGLPPFARIADSAEAAGRDLALTTLSVAHPKYDAATAGPGIELASNHALFNMLTFFSGISMGYGDIDTTRVAAMRLGLEEQMGAAGVVAKAERLYRDVASLNEHRVQAAHRLYLNDFADNEKLEAIEATRNLAKVLNRGDRPDNMSTLGLRSGVADSTGAHVGVSKAGIRSRGRSSRPMLTDFENTEHGVYLEDKAKENTVVASAVGYSELLFAMQRAEYTFFLSMRELERAATLARDEPSVANTAALATARTKISDIRSLYIDHVVAFVLFLAAHVYDDHTETTLRV